TTDEILDKNRSGKVLESSYRAYLRRQWVRKSGTSSVPRTSRGFPARLMVRDIPAHVDPSMD
ncbi:hypothetical protein RSAG8_12632, partial [Rhizoctonia solani AG-8 WAC10335]